MSTDKIELWERYSKEKSSEIRNEIAENYINLVKYLAHRVIGTLPNGMDREDLIQYGYLGLFEAIEKYDSNKGAFETYASFIIKGRLYDRIREYRRNSGGLSRTNINKMKEIEKATSELQKELGRSPSTEEIALKMGVDMNKYYKMLNDVGSTTMISLDKMVGIEENLSTMDIIKDNKQESPEEFLIKEERKKIIAESIEQLPRKERLIVELYYYEKLKLNDIGEILGLSESRISQLHTQAMLRLKTKLQTEI